MACSIAAALLATAASQGQQPPATAAHEAAPKPAATPEEQARQQALFEQDEKILRDWPNLNRYQAANAALAPAAASVGPAGSAPSATIRLRSPVYVNDDTH